MKEDYLWDKTGSDPEIERLENALKAFRFQEIAPPALPAKIIPFERKTPRGFLRLAFGFAAGATLAIICLGVWFQLSSGKPEAGKDFAETIAPPVSETVRDEHPVEKSDVFAVKKAETPKQFVERNNIKIRKVVPAIARQIPAAVFQNRTIAQRKTEFKKPPVKLTDEEKYAYNQLMLALAITSSKLKLVEDKIYGANESKTVLENER